MNPYAMVAADEALRVANERLAELRRENRDQRRVAGVRPHRAILGAARSTLSSLRTAFASVDDAAPVLPRLADYPSRG